MDPANSIKRLGVDPRRCANGFLTEMDGGGGNQKNRPKVTTTPQGLEQTNSLKMKGRKSCLTRRQARSPRTSPWPAPTCSSSPASPEAMAKEKNPREIEEPGWGDQPERPKGNACDRDRASDRLPMGMVLQDAHRVRQGKLKPGPAGWQRRAHPAHSQKAAGVGGVVAGVMDDVPLEMQGQESPRASSTAGAKWPPPPTGKNQPPDRSTRRVR